MGIVYAVWAIIVAVIGTGWVFNIIDIIEANFDPLTGLLVVKVIGIFIPPLGAIMGYFF